MAKGGLIEQTGIVTEKLPNVMFRVELDVNGSVVLCTLSGKMKKNFIKVIPGDNVKIEMSPYDLTKGRITSRITQKPVQDQVMSRGKNNKKRR